uniref:Uncharacterized protein n=1 Tax=Anguilla anguilla TaxID=7936 RepID=A0A0E9RFS0_ANGAN
MWTSGTNYCTKQVNNTSTQCLLKSLKSAMSFCDLNNIFIYI